MTALVAVLAGCTVALGVPLLLAPEAPTHGRRANRDLVPVRLARLLDGCDLGVAPGTAVALWLGGAAAAIAAAPVAPSGPVLGVAVLAGGPLVVLARRDTRRRRRRDQLAPALDAAASGLRAGRSLRQALADAASVGPPLGRELEVLAARAQHGRPLATELAGWTALAPDGPSRLAGTALTVAAEVGGSGARALDGAALSVRSRAAAEVDADTLATQARTSVAVMTLAPVAFTAVMAATDGRTASFLLGRPAGWAMLAAGLALDAAGALWMGRIVGRAT